ncbi:MAG TPA: hypothetical protein VN920_02235, partial [Pyrinomonadaceae bacterium]|nr:hypothetical protein [Pyrinomonadaceae bacterium]
MKLHHHKLFICFVGVLLTVSQVGNAPVSGQKPAQKAFEPGEQLIYKAEISRSLLKKLDVATFKFSMDRDAV